METVLTIEHLKKQYDDLTVLKDISLTVHEGEVIVIVGPSGCGKSTLLRCINALEEIQGGEIRLGENAISKETLLNWINEEIKALGEENFFHKDYEETLTETYGLDYEESLVVEGGVPAAAGE